MVYPPPQPHALFAWMECLSDPTRLRLLRLLEHHELGVVELCDVLQLPQSTVSRHLKVLADQRWVRNHRQATTHLYRMIQDELDPSARRLWALARQQTQDWATHRQDELRLTRRLREKQANGQAFFANAASQWDKLRTDLYGQSFALAALAALLPRDSIIADLGCGTGKAIEQLAPHVEKVIGIDNSPPMLKSATRRLANHKNVDLLRADLTALPIDDASCDAAMLILALTYSPDPLTVLKEMSRILKPTGRAVIIDLLPHDRDDFRRQLGQLTLGFPPATILQLLTDAPLSSPQLHPLPPEPTAKGPALFLATAVKQYDN
ncbi:MAG: metalloregulator ArsR/SmtB family transcription factor, partial [Planctomycetota bacterium]|nr:metalloregulator ArsR/SmtB family transcription factor [Planctomycetota bacterium]